MPVSLAVGVENRSDVEALQERAPGDVLGELLDRDAGLHAPDVRLGQNKLVEGDVARRRQGDLLNGSSHRDGLRDGRRKTLSRLPTRHEDRRSPLPFMGWVKNRDFRGNATAEYAPACQRSAGYRCRRSRPGGADCRPGRSVIMQSWQSDQLTFYPVRVPAVGRSRDHNPVCCGLDARGDGTLL